ncbi:unnamed protein product [Thlaspi arvense]|uniref:F-box domain-containing protein n=1 Tax=Thlaspi arvense TaxID=13288 RepID=A0AAU9SDY6_THLAR|nr:unnamed protein product [Thlaspi arvense]
MDIINRLPDELLLKILTFLPTKTAVSTSILSKQWEFLWMWLPNLEYDELDVKSSVIIRFRDFIDKNLPLHRAPIIQTLILSFQLSDLSQPENIKRWVGTAVSRCVRELSIYLFCFDHKQPADVSLPSGLYTCNSLTALTLYGKEILVDVPPTAYLPSLKTLLLECVTYLNEDSLRLLLSCCPVLEDLSIEGRSGENVGKIVVNIPSLQRLSLNVYGPASDGYVIVTPSLKYFKFDDCEEGFSYLAEHMPMLKEAYISVVHDTEKLLESIASVKLLTLRPYITSSAKFVYPAGMVFNQLEHLKVHIHSVNWSKLLVWLLRNSPKLRILNVYCDDFHSELDVYEPVKWDNEQSSVPECLLRSLETLKFAGYRGREEERDFLSFLFKHACCLKSTSVILHVS